MISLHLDAAAREFSWRRSSTGWQAGPCIVEPFRHAALEDFAIQADGRLLIVVRERCAGQPRPEHAFVSSGGLAEVEARVLDEVGSAMRNWPLQWLTLTVVDAKGRLRAAIETGEWGVAPVFGVAKGTELFCDWDPARLYPALVRPQLDVIRAAHFLAAFDAPYARYTLLPEMMMLTERAQMLWNSWERASRRLAVRYPAAVDPPMPRELKLGADPPAAFWEILNASFRRWRYPGAPEILVEVSGGLDSAVVAAAAINTAGAPLRSCGLALLGDSRQDQRRRRRAVTGLLGLTDYELDIRNWLPFAPGTCRVSGGPTVPWEECYYEAVDAMLVAAATSTSTLVITGLGGDELYGRRPGESGSARGNEIDLAPPSFLGRAAREAYYDTQRAPERVPQPLAARSVPECLAIGSAMYMRRGMWAVHPLATPQLVRFCAQLPRTWRAGRTVLRTLLTRLGYPPLLIQPAVDDDFMPALAAGLRYSARPLLTKLFRSPRLAELGLVDRDELVASYARWCVTGHDIDGAMPFYAAAILELTLQAIEG